jgi:hypothetical protein
MTLTAIWALLRPLASVAFAILAAYAAIALAGVFPESELGKGMSDFGFLVSGSIFLPSFLLVTYFARLRWWDCSIPAVIPLYIFGWHITEYWTARIFLAFVAPLAIAALASVLFQRLRLPKKAPAIPTPPPSTPGAL